MQNRYTESVFFYLKALACIVLIGSWSILINHTSNITPQVSTSKKTNITNEAHKNKQEIISYKKLKTETKKNPLSEPPKLAYLDSQETSYPTASDKEAAWSKYPSPVLRQYKQDKDANLGLRGKITLNKNKLKPVLRDILGDKNTFDLQESWLPRYLIKNNITSYFDKIASQLEVAGLVKVNKNSNAQAVIIRNKVDNYIEILRVGEEYKGLKVLSIKNNCVKFGNPRIDTTYTFKPQEK